MAYLALSRAYSRMGGARQYSLGVDGYVRATQAESAAALRAPAVRARVRLGWAIALSAVPPALWLAGVVRRRPWRHPPGRCGRCGYDLRATPDAAGPRLGRCPECGAAVPTPPNRGPDDDAVMAVPYGK